MAHPSVVINGIVYSSVPEIDVPKSGGGTAKFYDSTDMTVTAGSMLNGIKAIGASGEVTGNIQSKAAETYTPSASSQSIASGQYLSGAQTIKAVTTTNLTAANIASGVTVTPAFKAVTGEDGTPVRNLTRWFVLPSNELQVSITYIF